MKSSTQASMELVHENLALYQSLYRIRRFEETVLESFARGVFYGTTHTCLGQEANAVGVLSNFHHEDIVFSSHRCHGHFLAYGGDMRALFAELMGKSTGVCAGRGGSQHLQWRNFYSNGIQGGIVPVATGMALAEKQKGSGSVVSTFLGDGTLGEGVVYEALNMGSLWKVPILYVVENNHIAQTTPISLTLAGDICARFTAFGIPAHPIDSSDVLEIQSAAAHLFDEIREGIGPRALVINTQRLGPHSKGDDTRDPQVLEKIKREFDPLSIHAQRLSSGDIAAIEEDVNREVLDAFETALNDPYPQSQELVG
jgi:acetoin:2,6-dichlorophenolindophenol oxidoreductase subunit alpha